MVPQDPGRPKLSTRYEGTVGLSTQIGVVKRGQERLTVSTRYVGEDPSVLTTLPDIAAKLTS